MAETSQSSSAAFDTRPPLGLARLRLQPGAACICLDSPSPPSCNSSPRTEDVLASPGAGPSLQTPCSSSPVPSRLRFNTSSARALGNDSASAVGEEATGDDGDIFRDFWLSCTVTMAGGKRLAKELPREAETIGEMAKRQKRASARRSRSG